MINNVVKKRPVEYAKEACDAIMHQYEAQKLPPEGIFFYHQGVFLSGMEHTFRLTKEKKYFEYIKDYVDHVIGKNGELYGVDHELGHISTSSIAGRELTMLDCKQPGILLFPLFEETGDQKYLKAARTLAESMHYWPVNSYGGYWHMMTKPDQMWMDGAYMIGPLSVMCADYFNDPVLRERAVQQVLVMNEHIRDEKTGLYFHGWDPTKQARWAHPETGLSPQIWGRAVGWYAVAVLDILEMITVSHPKAGQLIEIEKDLLAALKKYQDPETGMWCEVLNKPTAEGNWVESSCTNLFIYSYAKAMRMGIITSEEYGELLKKAYEGSTKCLYYDEKGNLVVDYVCIGTCIDEGTYEHYVSRAQIKNDLHGMGAFLLMCCEVESLLRQLEA